MTHAIHYGLSTLSDLDIYLFKEGNHTKLYEKFGAHNMVHKSVEGVHFTVWAPNAKSVSVRGDFNDYAIDAHPLKLRDDDSGLWEGFIEGVAQSLTYKYHIVSKINEIIHDKSDPFAFFAEKPPKSASRIWSLDGYAWQDEKWMQSRHAVNAYDAPVSVYEMHLGSWKRKVEEENRYLTYRELAVELLTYLQQMNYTHVEFMPLTEYPYFGSWGYQVTGYFSATSRFGEPEDLMYLIDILHENGIGVIMDWVPSHFAVDMHGLVNFDGTALYEHADPQKGFHPEWGSFIFNYGRNEVKSFLISSAMFWLDKYHIDGIRVDAVASMLYLNYAREEGEWTPNVNGGNENLEAVAFLRKLNESVYAQFPDIMMIAEESTAWPMVTRPTSIGGLGFGFKWNMGWMHDMLDYMEQDPIYRRYHQNQVTFSLMYAFSENFVLPFSHDEVVHLKRSMLDKMPGDLWQKYANLRALYGYMYGHPGKKLLFMGGEFGQWSEWSEARSLDWHLLEWQDHRQLQRYVKELNHLYLSDPALSQIDDSWEGFQWIDISDADQSIVSFIRRAKDPADQVVIVCNFTPVPRMGYRVGMPVEGGYREIMNSDWPQYGGSGVGNDGPIIAEPTPWQSCDYSVPLNLPPLGVIYLKPLPTIMEES